MLHLLKTGSILFLWFAHFKKTTFCKTLCIQKGLFCQGLFCELRKASVQVRQSENRPLSEVSKRNKKTTRSSCFRSNIGSVERRLAPCPAKSSSDSLRQVIRGDRHTKQASTGHRKYQMVQGGKASRSQKRSGIEWRNRKWHRIFFSSICIFFSGCNRSFAAFSVEWQASGGKLTLLKYEFHRLCFLQNTKSDQSLLIGKRGLSCSRPDGRIGGVYWRVKFNLWKLFNLIHRISFQKHVLRWSYTLYDT